MGRPWSIVNHLKRKLSASPPQYKNIWDKIRNPSFEIDRTAFLSLSTTLRHCCIAVGVTFCRVQILNCEKIKHSAKRAGGKRGRRNVTQIKRATLVPNKNGLIKSNVRVKVCESRFFFQIYFPF